MPYAILADRAVLALRGADALELLQGLVTNDVAPATQGGAVYAALLTPQGKYLFDFFIAGRDGALLLDCQASRKDELRKRLTLYRLRSQVEIADASAEFTVAALFGDDLPAELANGEGGGARAYAGGVVYTDPRLPAAGFRAMLPDPASAMADAGIPATDAGAYEQHRLALALPDSERDLVIDKSLVLESNLEALHGVDFSKGCFVGQEVTARTKYRGLVRKRLLGVRIDGEPPAAGTPIRFDGKDAGTMRSAGAGRGMALLRLDAVAAAEAAGAPLTAAGASLTPVWPDWLPPDLSADEEA